jgi:acyl-CoA hydrolase
LPSTARGGAISRISLALSGPAPSLNRAEIDTVVTEHGSASLAGLSIDERASALISIAAPAFRDALAKSWCRLRETF